MNDLPGAFTQEQQTHAARFGGRGFLLVLLGIFGIWFISQSFVVVQAGERAVIFSRLSGMLPYQVSEGFHFNLPFVWQPVKYDIKTLTYTMSGGHQEGNVNVSRQEGDQYPDDAMSALTSDGLPVSLDISVRFHIDPENVWKLHRDLGPEFTDKVVRPQARSLVRTVVAEYAVIDVYSAKRQEIAAQLQRELRDKMAANYLILDEVLLRDVRFPPEFQQAIEQKQVAQQQAQQMVYEVERASSEKQQRILEAQGEAEAIRKKAEALAKNPQLIPYEYVKRLPSDVKVVVTDGKMIVNLGDLLGNVSTPQKGPGTR